jgi:hypothetical protein
MTKEEYMELVGESPEDMFGPDWQAYLADLHPLTLNQNKNARFTTSETSKVLEPKN